MDFAFIHLAKSVKHMSKPQDLFPGFKTSPIDPSRELRPPLRIAHQPPTPAPEYRDQPDDDDYNGDDDGDDVCEACEGLGYTDCFCGGDLCVCRYGGEIPCFNCC